jgi:hypothetical protein
MQSRGMIGTLIIKAWFVRRRCQVNASTESIH